MHGGSGGIAFLGRWHSRLLLDLISTDRRQGRRGGNGFEIPYCVETRHRGYCGSSEQFDLFAMGTDAETVHATFHIDAQVTFEDLLAKFNECFLPKVTVIHRRAIFSARC